MASVVTKIFQKAKGLFQLAKGAYSTLTTQAKWQIQAGDVGADKLNRAIQGILDRNAIAQSINGLPNPQLEWVRNWVKNSSEAEIKKFLMYITGSESISFSNST